MVHPYYDILELCLHYQTSNLVDFRLFAKPDLASVQARENIVDTRVCMERKVS